MVSHGSISRTLSGQTKGLIFLSPFSLGDWPREMSRKGHVLTRGTTNVSHLPISIQPVCVWVCVCARVQVYDGRSTAIICLPRLQRLGKSSCEYQCHEIWTQTHTCACMLVYQHVSVHSSTSQLQICWSLLKPPKAIFFGYSEIYRALCTPLWCVVKKKKSQPMSYINENNSTHSCVYNTFNTALH